MFAEALLSNKLLFYVVKNILRRFFLELVATNFASISYKISNLEILRLFVFLNKTGYWPSREETANKSFTIGSLVKIPFLCGLSVEYKVEPNFLIDHLDSF